MEAAHISWRPLGQLLLDEELLTPEQLEEALDKQATTGRRLGEVAVELGFVSHMALSRVLSAQYGVELKSETGFGTGLRAELARREDDGEPELPGPDFIVALPPLELAPPPPPTRDERLRDLEHELEALRQTSEYGHEEATRLAEALSAREGELMLLRDEYQRRYAQAARFATRVQELRHEPDGAAVTGEVDLLRDAHEYRHAQAVRFATGLRERDARIGALEHELSEVHRAAEERRANAEHTDREAELLAESLHERDGQLADLRETHARRQSQALKFASRMRVREAELTYERASLGEALAQIEAISSELAHRNTDVERLEGELGNLHGAVGDAREEAANFSELVGTRDAEIAGLHDELANIRHGADEGHNEAARLADVLSVRDRELGELREELEGLHRGAHDGHAEATRLAEVLGHRDAELAQLREAVNRTEEDATRLAEEVRGRDGVVAALEGELASRDDLVATLQSELVAVKEATDHGHDEAAQLAEALSSRDGQLAARERELAALHQAYGHRYDQATRFARRLRQTPDGDPHSYLIFAQFARRYALVERGGVLPSPDALLELPDVGRGTLRVVRVGPSPLPNDGRSCVFTEYVHGPDDEQES